MQVYLDNSATTKTFSVVNEKMIEMMTENYGNPSSLHRMGMNAEDKISFARGVLSSYLKCNEKNIYFTSGGTEANNLAILGYVLRNPRKGKRVITTVAEHASVSEPFKYLETQGYDVKYVKCKENGKLDYDELSSLIDDNTSFVSVMQVNNETGEIFDIKKIKDIISSKNKNTVLHSDCVQSFMKIPLEKDEILTFSSLIINGPKGVGAIYIKDGLLMKPIIYGGGQEKGLRNGTENAVGIYGFGIALSEHIKNDKSKYIKSLKLRLLNGLKDMDKININTDIENSAPHILNISFTGIRSEIILHTLEQFGIYVSSGSACSNNGVKEKVLEKMGFSKQLADSAIRFSLSGDNTKDEIDYAIETVKREIEILRKRLK